MQSRLVFFPEKLPLDHDFALSGNDEEFFIKTPDGEIINGILFRAQSPQGVVLYFHGNAGSLRTWKEVAEDFRALNYDIFIIDYRGFGKSSGQPSEQGLYTDAYASYGFLLLSGYDAREIVVYGRSIGSGVAVDLASRETIRALILESPFTTLLDVANHHYWFFFPRLFLRYQFDNIEKVDAIDAPILLIHGDRDRVIPFKHSELLFERVGVGENAFIRIQGGGHNDLKDFPEYHEGIRNFLNRLPHSTQ